MHDRQVLALVTASDSLAAQRGSASHRTTDSSRVAATQGSSATEDRLGNKTAITVAVASVV